MDFKLEFSSGSDIWYLDGKGRQFTPIKLKMPSRQLWMLLAWQFRAEERGPNGGGIGTSVDVWKFGDGG